MVDMKSQVESEIEPFRQEYGDEALIFYLNSWFLRLPDNRYPRNGYCRGFDDTDWRTKFRDLEVADDRNSTVFLNQTPEEFYEGTIDRLIAKEQISFDEIQRLQNERQLVQLGELTLPVVIIMREIGYNMDYDIGGNSKVR